jgi:hypothetical protein
VYHAEWPEHARRHERRIRQADLIDERELRDRRSAARIAELLLGPRLGVVSAMPNSELILASGRTIRLYALRQWTVYSGLIEGLPTREMNAAELERVRREARARNGHEPFLAARDPEFIAADRIRDESRCVVRCERMFMRPIFLERAP